jgi:hypothetical protein
MINKFNISSYVVGQKLSQNIVPKKKFSQKKNVVGQFTIGTSLRT